MRAMPFTPAGTRAAILVAWGVAFILSCQILSVSLRTQLEPDPSAAGRLMSASRQAIAAFFYERADQYFHRGVPHIFPEAFANSIFQRMKRAMAPVDHLHLHDYDAAEMMPWLSLAIDFDSGNPQNYLVASYWLTHEAKRPQVALELLEQGEVNVPFNYEIQLAKGRLLLRRGKFREAASAFAAGLAFWPSRQPADKDDIRLDKAALLLYRGVLHEAEDEPAAAIDDYEEILTLFPEREEIRQRIRSLKNDEESALSAEEYLRHLIVEGAEAVHHDHAEHETEPEAEAHGDHLRPW